jgi:hypothetical protein
MAFSPKLVAENTTKNQALNAKEKKPRDDEKAPIKAYKIESTHKGVVIPIPCGYSIIYCNKDAIEVLNERTASRD